MPQVCTISVSTAFRDESVAFLVVQDVKPTERPNRRLDHALDAGFVRDIRLDRHRRGAKVIRNTFGLLPAEAQR